jgi:hypothetical protein
MEAAKNLYTHATEDMARGKAAKRLFAKYADREFVDSLTTIHWSFSHRYIIQLLNKASRNEEISCAFTLGSVLHPGGWRGHMGDHGLVVKGYITLLANDMDNLISAGYSQYAGPDAYTKRVPIVDEPGLRDKEVADWYVDFFKKRRKTSGINKIVKGDIENGIVLSKEDYKPSNRNEALVDHWRPLAVVTEPRYKDEFMDRFPKIFCGTDKEVAEHLGLRVQ